MANTKARLVTFLDQTLDLLQDVVTIPQGLIPADMQGVLTSAWSEFEQQFNRNDAHAKVRALSETKLADFGLTGKQLDLKLSIIERLQRAFLANRVKDILRKLLDAIDTLLESLLEAAGLKHALKEIKEAIKNILDIED